MKRTLLTIISLTITTLVIAQNPVLRFDGIDDYVDLGSDVGNGVRTIEMWFKTEEQIDSTLGNFVALVARETPVNNIAEFSISFQPDFMPNPGTIRFNITEALGVVYDVYSDNNLWEADKWYHIAAVVDSTEGMKLFINGIKQSSTNLYVLSPQNNNSNTTLGAWGNVSDRFFLGSLDDVRFSSEALYDSNFTPPCPDLNARSNTIGLWNFNEGTGNIATDSGSNNYDGMIMGPTWNTSNICNNAISLDGIDDYVDLGSDVGNGVRTIEMWFKTEEQIDSTLENFVALVARDTPVNIDEFSISFQPDFMPNPGTIRFNITEALGVVYDVYSDNNLWEADKWYHIAAVVDSTEGMKLFINGIKQSSTNLYVLSPQSNSSNTTLGAWGNVSDRFFLGSLDDVRFSSEALYDSNFTPPCPDLNARSNTIGLWNFNEGTGNVAIDASLNNYDGQLVGATRIIANICSKSATLNISNYNNLKENLLSIYPNPSSGIFHFNIENDQLYNFDFIVYNSVGQVIRSEKINKNNFYLNISNEKSGIYYYQVFDREIIISGKLIKE